MRLGNKVTDKFAVSTSYSMNGSHEIKMLDIWKNNFHSSEALKVATDYADDTW